MSYYQGGQYGQPPQQPPHQGYQDPYSQNPPTQQNGGYAGQYASSDAQYHPGYASYPAGGGPVQQPQTPYQDPYQSPRSTSFSGGGYGQPYQPGQPSYNPQQYGQPVPQYNPQAYVSPTTGQSPYPAAYNPAAYPEPPAHRPSGSAPDPYGYSPGNYANAQFSSPQTGSYGQQSPASQQQFSPHAPYSPQPPGHGSPYQYQQHPPPLPARPSGYDQSQYPSSQAQDIPYPSQPPPHRQNSMQVPPTQFAHNISPALPGLSDEPWLPSPPNMGLNSGSPYDPQVDRNAPSPLYPTNSNSSLPSPPGPTPPAHGVQRMNTLGRHPQARPLPGPPESDTEADYFNGSNLTLGAHSEEAVSQEDLFSEVENAVMNAGHPAAANLRSPSISVSQAPFDSSSSPQPLFAPSSPRGLDVGNGSQQANGHLSPDTHSAGGYSDESDAEAAAGLEAMRMADAADAADEARRQSGGSAIQARFSSYGSQRNSRQQVHGSDSDDFAGVDLGAFGGGYEAHMSYGGDPNQLAAGGEVNGEVPSQPVSSRGSMRRSQASSNPDYDYTMDSIHPFPPFSSVARVDAGGTGGLSEPSAHGRRQSYDEGDEYTLMEGQEPVGFPGEPPDLFYHPTTSMYRPLPPPPQDGIAPLNTDWRGQPGQSPYPNAPDAYSGINAAGIVVPRSTSLLSHSNTPQVIQPIRSKTDAEERRLRQQQYRSSGVYSAFDSTPASASGVAIDLPSLPTKRFMPSKLGAPDFKKCEEPWALSSIFGWLRQIINADQMGDLKETAVIEALVALFTNKVPTMNIADAETLSARVVQQMYDAETLITTEEWVRLGNGMMCGVIFQLTGAGCYAPTVHDHVMADTRCYAHHCQRTLKKVNLQAKPLGAMPDWPTYWHLNKEDCEKKIAETGDRKIVERQNQLHEIVQGEVAYMDQLNVVRQVYRDQLASAEPSIISPKRKDKFLKDVFGKIDAVKKVNEEHLLPQLRYRQVEQGPWIVGFSDIFRQWIRKAKPAYLEYTLSYPGAVFMIKQEQERNLTFRSFLERAQNDKRSQRLDWNTYLKAPITRLQRYSLLMDTVLRGMKDESEERTNLQLACKEVKEVTLDCNSKIEDVERKLVLTDLASKLLLRPGMQNAVELNLNHLGRQLIRRGDLARQGSGRFAWVESHVLLFDHYMVISKAVKRPDQAGGEQNKYDVSRLPIPMDLLVLESTNDDPVVRSSYVKGITTMTTVSTRPGAQLAGDSRGLGRTTSNQNSAGPNPLQHTNTSSSMATLQTVTSNNSALEQGGKDAERTMYPFKVKHLGRETYQLFSSSPQDRAAWCSAILDAKTKHANALFAQSSEPFRLRVMADSAFSYDSYGSLGGKSVIIPGTPVDRAIKEVEHKFRDTGRPAPICRARVNCATSFTTPYPGKQMIAVGTDFGVYVSELDNPRGWTKAISMSDVTQVAVLEEFNLFLLISNKSLIAYHLDVVCPTDRNGPTSTNDSARKAPQKLSGSRDVGFFVTGRMKDRTLVFYKKRENLSSTFKVLEPIFQKSTEKKRGIFKRGTTEFFREYDEFYIPAECTGMNLFHSSLAVSTARGFEVLTLDKKQPFSVPDLKQSHVQNIATHIKDQDPLAMLRLSEQEFLLCYDKCAVYVNKHGEVSRSVIMEFVGTAQSAALYGPYLILFDKDFVEIRNAQNGRLKQVIPGRHVKCLDDGGSWSTGVGGNPNGAVNGPNIPGSRTVKVVLQHPELDRIQVVVELLLNEGMKE